MNSPQIYFLISLLLITALIAIICLLILATDQPDAVLEGQRRIVLSPPPPIATQTEPTTAPLNVENILPREEFPLEIGLEKLAEFYPSNGGKFMSISLAVDPNLKESLFLAKSDGQIEFRELGKDTSFPIVRSSKLPIQIYRLRPINASISVLLDASFSSLQLWNVEKGHLIAEQLLGQPAKDIAVEGDWVFVLARVEDRIDAFSLAHGLRPMDSAIRLGEHCQSMARTSQSSLLLSCPSGLLQIHLNDGQVQRTFHTDGVPISSVQVLSGARESVVLAASRAGREMLLLDWSGKLKARMRPDQREEKGIWLWTGLAMFGDRIYALEYIRNRVEVFRVASHSSGNLLF